MRTGGAHKRQIGGKLTHLAILYGSDEQLAECQRNGINGRIKADYY